MDFDGDGLEDGFLVVLALGWCSGARYGAGSSLPLIVLLSGQSIFTRKRGHELGAGTE